MKHSYETIELAFEFVSSASQFENEAILSLDTGETYFVSGMFDSDELPDDIETSDRYVRLPHKNDLDLGKALVRRFVARHMPDAFDEVESFFRRRGAYARFKDLLDHRGMLDEWHAYENAQTKASLRQWCADNNIELAD
ncbi:MAG TPA: hypothetical protein DD670_02780 [Planctomycetaceae bacterium]|nr:hypothetical protein [Planctomycetaceae bacterium]